MAAMFSHLQSEIILCSSTVYCRLLICSLTALKQVRKRNGCRLLVVVNEQRTAETNKPVLRKYNVCQRNFIFIFCMAHSVKLITIQCFLCLGPHIIIANVLHPTDVCCGRTLASKPPIITFLITDKLQSLSKRNNGPFIVLTCELDNK